MATKLDVAIIGAGPAGLSAGIYLARAGLECTAFSLGPFGGALPEISRISNYPGFLGSGPDLAEAMKKQAEAAGARVEYGECSKIRAIEAVDGAEQGFILTIDGEEIQARVVLVATGLQPKTLDFEPDRPVSYCALCDGDLAKNKHVAVVGGGNSAVQEALYLANLAQKVTLVSHSRMKAEGILCQKAKKAKNLEIIENTEPTTEFLHQFDQIFVYIGKKPASGFLGAMDASILDAQGYVITGVGQRAHETAKPGIFAAGDVRSGMLRQVVTAAGDGAVAAVEIIDFMK